MDGAMIIKSIPDWLKEQEEKHHSIFLLEWVSTFACTFIFWIVLFHGLEVSLRSTAATTSALYACGFVYLRLFPVTRCKKCSSLLPLVREEIGRRHIHDEERTVEIERGGEDYWGHFIDIYNRVYHVDVVRNRCRRCHKVWDEVEQLPASNFRFVRTIRVKD